MTQTVEASGATPSRLVATEVRAELGRQQLSQRRLALQMGTTYQWVQRRLSIGAEIELTIEDVQRIAEALHVPAQRLLGSWLPRMDSNHQPAGYSGRPTRSQLTSAA